MQIMAGAPVGGAEAFFERLAAALGARSVDQTVVVRNNLGRVRRLRASGIDPETLPFGGRLDFLTRPKLRRLIAERRPQIVFSWMNRATAMCPRRVTGHRFVFVARLGGYYNLKYYRHCDHLVANTNGIRNYLIEQGWDPARAHYLPNFVEAGVEPAISRRTLGLPEDVPLIFAAGRLHENKGFDVLIRALPMIPNAHLCIAGSGPLESQLRRLAAEVGAGDRITWLGWLNALAPYYRAADVFVCSSRHEPLGNVIVEAWAEECPVVATAAQGPRELIEDGVSGLLVPLSDHERLAGAINQVLSQPTLGQRLKEGGRDRYLGAFTKDVVVDQYMAFFEKIAR
ncbi:MAG: glycosyltransferase [Alphaproteobacteria bacterium]|nr:glycosyltransferase [Alphaproteobacteria bacterium]